MNEQQIVRIVQNVGGLRLRLFKEQPKPIRPVSEEMLEDSDELRRLIDARLSKLTGRPLGD